MCFQNDAVIFEVSLKFGDSEEHGRENCNVLAFLWSRLLTPSTERLNSS